MELRGDRISSCTISSSSSASGNRYNVHVISKSFPIEGIISDFNFFMMRHASMNII